jgi:phage N-6-adenine-methyltransferase
MPSAVIYSHKKDNWQTPPALFDRLHAEHAFTIDGAADATNALLPRFWGPGSPIAEDALVVSWAGERVFCNPPYSIIKRFVEKAARERWNGAYSVLLITSRTDTRWWQNHIWPQEFDAPYPGVSVRFVRGRIKFVDPEKGSHGSNAAPFPSAIVTFAPLSHADEQRAA